MPNLVAIWHARHGLSWCEPTELSAKVRLGWRPTSQLEKPADVAERERLAKIVAQRDALGGDA